MPTFGRKVPHLWRDSLTSFKVRRQGHSVTHRAPPYLPNGKAYELETWYTDGGRWSTSAVGAVTSTVKGQGHTRFINTDRHLRHSECHSLRTSNSVYRWRTTTRISHRHHVKVTRSRDQSEPSWPNAVSVSLEAGGSIPCRPNPAATLLVNNYRQFRWQDLWYDSKKRASFFL